MLVLLFLIVLGIVLPALSQIQPKFDPARFEADLEQFITTEAGLTPQEARSFFPLYHEMRKKEKAFFGIDKHGCRIDTANDKVCEEFILQHDDNDIEMKKIQKIYHLKFMKLLPASKVFKVIQAEDKFHRQMFKRAAKHDRKRK